MFSTSHTLIERVRRLEPSAWERFCVLYGPVVYGRCRRCGLQDADAIDLTQEVFRSVFKGIGQFQARPSGGTFRGWLMTIVMNQVRLHFRKANRVDVAVGAAVDHIIGETSADDEGEALRERRRFVRRALELIRGDFSEQTWRIFERVALQGEALQEVAADLGIGDNAVRQAKFRVMRRLRQELAGLV